MFILTALLWAMSLVLFLTYPENEKTRWGSFIGFFGGFGGLSVILSYYLEGSSSQLQLIHYITSSIGHNGTARAIMIFDTWRSFATFGNSPIMTNSVMPIENAPSVYAKIAIGKFFMMRSPF